MANNRRTQNTSRASGDVNRTAPQSGDETQKIKRGLGKLDQQEKDYMENLANSLLKVQKVPIPKKKPRSKPKKETL